MDAISQVRAIACRGSVILKFSVNTSHQAPEDLRVSLGSGTYVLVASAWMSALAEPPRSGEIATSKPEPTSVASYVAVLTAPEGGPIEYGQRGVLEFRRAERVFWRQRFALREAQLADLADADVRTAVLDTISRELTPQLVDLLDQPMTMASSKQAGRHFLQAIQSGRGFVLDGFIEDDARRSFHIMSSDLQIWLPREQRVARKPEPHEARSVLRGRGGVKDGDWSTVIVPVPLPSNGQFYLVEEAGAEGLICYGPLAVRIEVNEAKAVQLAHQVFGDVRSLPTAAVDKVYRPLLALPTGPRNAQSFAFGPSLSEGDNVRASIIIPFYGDAFFLNCLFHLDRILPTEFEIIVVVDDVRLRDACFLALTERAEHIRLRTVLLCNERNYGYGPSNNLGFSVSSGAVTILMNSDVLVMDPAPLLEAVAYIEQRKSLHRQDVVLGFSLMYEDSSIQHAGITFPRSAQMNGLHIADHPMKGMPFSLYEGERERQVPAVTGALMALPRDLYARIGGFDESYERGDFEDADLCLRAQEAGAEVRVLMRRGLYHLERQSIPSMGGHLMRQAVTYLNCLTFNARWAHHLASTGADVRPRPNASNKIRVMKRKQP